MEDSDFQYVPFFGFPAAYREYSGIKDNCVRFEGTKGDSVIDIGFVEKKVFCVMNNFRYGVICAENLVTVAGLAYLCY